MPLYLIALHLLLLPAGQQTTAPQSAPPAGQQDTKQPAKPAAAEPPKQPPAQPEEPRVVQSMDPPPAYRATYSDARFGAPFTVSIEHNGSRVMVDQGMAGGTHVRSLYNLDLQTRTSWTTTNPAGSCVRAEISGDWGDPFRTTQFNGMDAHFGGMDRLRGSSANMMESPAASGGTARAWFDAATNLLLKVEETLPGSKPAAILDLTSFQQSPPPDSSFAVPPACSSPASADDLRAKLIPSRAADYVPANVAPETPTTDSCKVLFRVVLGGSLTPITRGFQTAIDLGIDPAHFPAYDIEVTPEGHATFGGGQLREVTGDFHNGALQIESPPAVFEIDTEFGTGGSAHALIRRQCFGPETTLLLIVRDPVHPTDANAWVWARGAHTAAHK